MILPMDELITEYLWRKIIQQIDFQKNEKDFSSIYMAEQWCKENWYSYGSMQREAPIAICKWDVDISKWRNLWEDIKNIDGIILPLPDFREWNAVIYILWEPVSDVQEDYSEHISDFPVPNEIPEYDFSQSWERMRYLSDIWELWELIDTWSSRMVFQHKKIPWLVIKIPIPGKEDDADWQSIEEYEQSIMRAKLWLQFNTKIPMIAKCIWKRNEKILYMQKVTPIPWAANLWMGTDGNAYQFDIF